MNKILIIRLGFFIGVFLVMACLELAFPRRKLNYPKPLRWFGNLGITALNSVLLPFIFPVLAVSMAVICQGNQTGLLNNVSLPYWASVIVGVVILDFVIYVQHVMFHTVPVLWRLHLMHHVDLDLDVTSGLRFHPLEIILSMGIKLAAIYVFGPSATAVLIFEILLNATAMFSHSNVYLPLGLDKMLRLLIVTPDMHRVHHSVVIRETNSNFGFNLSVWDRLAGTYRAQPARGHIDMNIGLSIFRDVKSLMLHRMLVLPFMGSGGDYSITGKGKEL